MVAGVGESGSAGVGNQSEVFALFKERKDFLGVFKGGVLVVNQEGGGDLVVVKEAAVTGANMRCAPPSAAKSDCSPV